MAIVRRNTVGNHPLVAYEWNPNTGIAALTFADGRTELRTEPMRPSHAGWSELSDQPADDYPYRMRSRGQRTLHVREQLAENSDCAPGVRADAMIEGLDADFCWQFL